MEFTTYTISVKGLFSRRYEFFENDVLKYVVKRNSIFSLRHFRFFDTAGNELLHIHKPLSFMKRSFKLYDDGLWVAEVTKGIFENKYHAQSADSIYLAEGNLLNTQYTIFRDDEEIAKISRKIFKINATYGIAMVKGDDELIVLAITVIIAIVNQLRKNKG